MSETTDSYPQAPKVTEADLDAALSGYEAWITGVRRVCNTAMR